MATQGKADHSADRMKEVPSLPPPFKESDSGLGPTSGTTSGQKSSSSSSIGDPKEPTDEDNEKAQIPKPKTAKDKNLKIGKDSLETAVAAIRHHHHLKQQQEVAPPVTATPGAPPSDAGTSPEYDLVLDGYMSVVLVTEAAAKCLYLRDHELNPAANLPMEKYCEWFLERLKHGGEISEEEKKHVVKKLIGIRNALSHANARYDYLPHDPATLVPMFILYEQIHQKTGGTGNLDPDEADYREVQRYTMSQFAHLCAIMREVFLSWKLIDPDSKPEPQTGAREVQMAVMGRDTDEEKPEEESTK